jgi:hypothetical protein
MSSKPKPVHISGVGAIEVAVWKNDTDKGSFYSVTMSRSFKKGEEWKQADSFGQDDLLLLAKLLDQAHSWMLEHPAKKQAA